MTDPTLTDLGNLLVENYWTLDFGSATGCRCMGCESFKFIDMDGKIVAERDSLTDLVRAVHDAGDRHGG